MTLKKGNLLIADPSLLNDNSFNRTVILLTEKTEVNSIGFILNKPLSVTVADLIPNVDCPFIIYHGGPVEQDNLYFIHQLPDLIPNSIEVGNGIYWGGNFTHLAALLNAQTIPSNKIRFFLGYSGWGIQQLESEMSSESWIVIENDYPNLFDVKTNSFWKEQLLKIGGKYKLWSNAPSDPQLN